jgi:AraC-like DNA-binding protein
MEILHKNPGPETLLVHLPPNNIAASPLFVSCSSRSFWRKGHYYGRDNSDTFWVEAVVSGNIHFTQNGCSRLVESGSLFFPRMGGSHFFTPGPAGFVLKRGLCIGGALLGTLLVHTGLDKTDEITPPGRDAFMRIIRYFKECDTILRARNPGFMYDAGMVAFRLLIELGLNHHQRYPPPIERALDYIHRHTDKHISDADIARAACISVAHLHRLFKLHINTTPCAYALGVKMEKAKHLLRVTALTVREIGYQLGYDDQVYFSAMFKRKQGVSPLRYRKQGNSTATPPQPKHSPDHPDESERATGQ